MAETDTTSTNRSSRQKDVAGKTVIADTVVATIAGIATREVDGVHAMGGSASRAMGAVRGTVTRQADHTRGVKVEVGEKQAAIDLEVVVLYGTEITDAAAAIRSHVAFAIERMTGLEVVEVNINIRDVHVPGDDSDDEEDARVR
ncbi:Asp23/Gls24 family envelope stress response protein [Streptomyces sp. V4-01]|uniref:Asp23/Gls24 family envelope stress response protein n=1 Tax=Actinacidiphila polyblastidii TaxID=3110430 RepID=A0ABU7PG31_9ACTN|nr:Asp23/Gls24 family envelope stress response protein [Streptomyces sp. V4-01]